MTWALMSSVVVLGYMAWGRHFSSGAGSLGTPYLLPGWTYASSDFVMFGRSCLRKLLLHSSQCFEKGVSFSRNELCWLVALSIPENHGMMEPWSVP